MGPLVFLWKKRGMAYGGNGQGKGRKCGFEKKRIGQTDGGLAEDARKGAIRKPKTEKEKISKSIFLRESKESARIARPKEKGGNA